MRLYQLILLTFLVNYSCSQLKTEKEKITNPLYPLEVKLMGEIESYKKFGLFSPNAKFNIYEDSVILTLNHNETYHLGKNNSLDSVIKLFTIDDFRDTNFYYNPFVKKMGYMKISKNINDTTFTQQFTDYRRSDIKIKYSLLNEDEIFKFTKLQDLLSDIVNQKLLVDFDCKNMKKASSFEEALKNPNEVYSLILTKRTTKKLPDNIDTLKNLKYLSISGTLISELPESIGNLDKLIILSANASRLKQIPKSIAKLKRLREMNLSACKLDSIPEEIGSLTTLWSLSLASNKLSCLPKSISNLKNVSFFTLDNNNFETFPKECTKMLSLHNLWIHNNKFETIPKQIQNLENLGYFLVDAHKIKNIEEIKSLIPNVRIIDKSKR